MEDLCGDLCGGPMLRISDMLPLLQSQQLPTQSERRGMAKRLGVVQMIDGNMVCAASLMTNLQRSFVELVLTRRCDLDSGIGQYWLQQRISEN